MTLVYRLLAYLALIPAHDEINDTCDEQKNGGYA